MAKIYENGIKLTNVQVTEVLMNEMPSTHREIFRKTLDSNIPHFRKRFAHAVLDCYKVLPTTTEQEEKSKKYCKFLMEKYMKSSTTADGEESAMQLLVNDITNEKEERG